MSSTAATRLERLQARLKNAAKKAGRDPNSVRLVASSRACMVDPVVAIAKLGVKDLAEDYLPEGVTKRPPVDRAAPGLTWHFTGTLPAQKLSLAVEFFDWIHSIDRLSITRPLAEAMEQNERHSLHLLIEVNVLGLKKRTGATPGEIPALVESLGRISGAIISGLSFKTELATLFSDGLWAYRRVRELHQEWLTKGILPPTAKELAMGSSRDFEEAIAAGATIVRIGSALFGPKVQGTFSEF